MLIGLVHFTLLATLAVQLILLRRRPQTWPLLLLLGPLVVQAVVTGAWALTVAGIPVFPRSGSLWLFFSSAQAQAWAGFLYLPLVLVAVAARIRSFLPAIPALAIAAVGVDAFLVEPGRLETTLVSIPGPGVRIVLVADLQTDDFGDWERGALDRVARLEPDLVLFSGDYLQVSDDAAFHVQARDMNAALRVLHPPLGMIAVRGDVDNPHWMNIFEGLSAHVVQRSTTLDLGPLVVTALSPEDSRSWDPPVQRQDKVHVVLGHGPDFASERPPADLYLAGHTHGGQVVVPFYGPLMTLTRLPRDQASGATWLENGAVLVVSRGIGLERLNAPRIRFLCPPEIVVVDLGK